MRRIIVFLAALMLLLPTVSAQNNLPITITDATGSEITLTALDRIVSGSGDVTEIIYALGFYNNLVGVDSSSTYPPQALEEKVQVGFARRLAAEPIINADPDVVFCTEICDPPEVLDQVRQLGIPVVIIPDDEGASGLELPARKIAMVAEALGVPEKGAALIERVSREIDWVQTALANVPDTPAVFHFYIRGRGLQLAAGPGTPAHAMIVAAGGHNAAEEAGVAGYQPLTPEIILAAFPDYLILTSGNVESSGGLDKILEVQGLADTPAVQNNNILVIDTELFLAMSLRTGEALMLIADTIHPSMTWEVQVNYPYRVTDASGSEVTVEGMSQLYATNDGLLQTTRQLGFHTEPFTQGAQGVVIASQSDDWQTLRDSGLTVLVVSDAADAAEIAGVLNVPGRGEALNARLAQ